MGDTKIAWTDKSWNPIRGCSVVSAGCENCYAMRQAHRFSGSGKAYDGLTRMTRHGPKWTGKVRLVPELLDQPLRWKKPKRIFVNSMSDLFHDDVPDAFIAAVFGVMANAQHHTFQVLTKRPERMRRWFEWAEALPKKSGHEWRDGAPVVGYLGEYALKLSHGKSNLWRASIKLPAWPLPNVWLGTSVENQNAADERIPELLYTPAVLRFLSVEPLLEALDLDEDEGGWLHIHPDGQTVIDWVIVGGESGPGSRPCNVEWIRSIVAQCRAAKVPAFVKQLGRWVVGEPQSFAIDRYMLRDGRVFVPPLVGKHEHDAPADAIAFSLFDRKGSIATQWPEDLRVQEFPL